MTRDAVLSDQVWARIEPLLPSSEGRRGRPFRDSRQVVEGIVYRYRAGIAWRDLPESFGPWQTVWKRHHRFAVDGTWEKVLARVLTDADAAGELDWAVSVGLHDRPGSSARGDRGPHTGGSCGLRSRMWSSPSPVIMGSAGPGAG